MASACAQWRTCRGAADSRNRRLFARRNEQWGISWGESLRWGKRRGDRIGLSAVTAAGARLGRRYISFGCKGAIGPTHKQPRRSGKDMLFHCHISPARSPYPSTSGAFQSTNVLTIIRRAGGRRSPNRKKSIYLTDRQRVEEGKS